MPGRRHVRSLLLVASLASASASAACNGATAGGGHGGPGGGHGGPGGRRGGGDEGEAGMKVVVTHLEPARIERWYRSSGTLTAVRSAELVAVQTGIIKDITVDEGDRVTEGQTLARLDGRELALQASASQLQVENLAKELERLEAARGVVSAEEIDKQRYLVEEARAASKLAKQQSKQTVVKAPFAGTIVARHVDEGNLANTATPLFSLSDLDALELELHIPEQDAASVRRGTKVEIELVDGTEFTAEVFRRAPIVDPVTGTVKFTVRTSEYPEVAMPGAFARARVLVVARDDVPSVDREAIFELEGVPHVYVVAEGKARRREVKTGLEGSGRMEIVEGLQPDDVVVAEGKGGVTEGMPLVAVEAEDLAAEDAGGSGSAPVPNAGS